MSLTDSGVPCRQFMKVTSTVEYLHQLEKTITPSVYDRAKKSFDICGRQPTAGPAKHKILLLCFKRTRT